MVTPGEKRHFSEQLTRFDEVEQDDTAFVRETQDFGASAREHVYSSSTAILK